MVDASSRGKPRGFHFESESSNTRCRCGLLISELGEKVTTPAAVAEVAVGRSSRVDGGGRRRRRRRVGGDHGYGGDGDGPAISREFATLQLIAVNTIACRPAGL